MELVLLGVAAIFGIIGFVCNIFILIHAFKASVGEGFLCFCVPCYIIYYMFAKFEHPQKNLIIAGSLGGSAISNGIVQLSGLGSGGSYGGY